MTVAAQGKTHARAEADSERLPTLKDLLERSRQGERPTAIHLALLGLDPIDENQLRKRVENGLEYQTFARVQALMDLSRLEAAALVQIPVTTLHRREAEGRLRPVESDRLVRASRMLGMALELFGGDREAVRRWLDTPKAALDGETPLAVAKTEVGARMVENLLGRIAHGVYT